jgi:hypothetical protein
VGRETTWAELTVDRPLPRLHGIAKVVMEGAEFCPTVYGVGDEPTKNIKIGWNTTGPKLDVNKLKNGFILLSLKTPF